MVPGLNSVLDQAMRSGLFEAASDDVIKCWDEYYKAVGRAGDDSSGAIAVLQKQGFDLCPSEAAEEIFVKSMRLRRVDLDAPTQVLFEKKCNHLDC
ncbi:hypothetical protein DTL42_19495 [Bremerella cremea]|uniref:Uncharacterized protein n=1 Tax=Bremerella cremea TaxID=1031537 RepID=A0A368KMA2_9BACT|nr:hypothetical protein DTL42_19495 [Bremerella cremea]